MLISHASKVMLKILQARLQQYMTENFQMDQLGLKKAVEAEIKLPTFNESKRKQRDSRKASASASFTMLKPLTVDHKELWKILQEMGIPDHFT